MVDYINWKGKDWPVKFGGAAFSEYSAKTGKNITEESSDPDCHSKFLWIGIKTAHRLLNEKFFKEDGTPIISEEECFWMFDDCVLKYWKIFNNSLSKILESEDKSKKK